MRHIKINATNPDYRLAIFNSAIGKAYCFGKAIDSYQVRAVRPLIKTIQHRVKLIIHPTRALV